jgi:hypothetical protein
VEGEKRSKRFFEKLFIRRALFLCTWLSCSTSDYVSWILSEKIRKETSLKLLSLSSRESDKKVEI